MNESDIKSAIERVVGTTSYSSWIIGITNDPVRRRKEHDDEGENTKYWHDWKADSETIARNVEKYFQDKGMKGSTGGGEHPTYVYIF